MGFLDRFIDKEKLASATITNPREVFSGVLKQLSGTEQVRDVKYNIFYQIIAFKGVMGGVGCSTLVANTALCLAELGLNICVIDTSITRPVQDVLLKTGYMDTQDDKKLDWFDLPYTKQSVLHISKLSSKISVLSFYGKRRGIIDALSVSDSDTLVELALAQLHTKFDVILIDCCDELTKVEAACLQQCHHVIQVWNDDPLVTSNIEGFIDECAALSCSLDKMKHVIYSKTTGSVQGNIDDILNKYRLVKIAENPFSEEIHRIHVMGKPLYQYASKEDDVIEYTDCIINIAFYICNIKNDNLGRGTVSSEDILNGKVEGTVTKKLQDREASINKDLGIVNTLDEVDAQLSGSNNKGVK